MSIFGQIVHYEILHCAPTSEENLGAIQARKEEGGGGGLL